MKRRWYISTLVIILSFLGVLCEQQISVPNQEIVLEFTNTAVTTEETQITLEIVKKQLNALGVQNIQVKEIASGRLKITYYSDSDVTIIKETLSKEKNLELDSTSFSGNETGIPSDENPIAYNLDVHEILKGNDADWGFNGKYVLEIKPKSDRFFYPKVYVTFNEIDIRNNECKEKVTYKINRNIAIAIDNTSRNIPEVRAGPVC
jgi:hypothetical protein